MVKEEYYIDIAKDLKRLFSEVYYEPIFELFTDEFYNSTKVLLDRIASGLIVYKDGAFSGKFSIQTSKELSKFAKFDKRSKKFKVKDPSMVPKDVIATATNANQKSKRLHDALNDRIEHMTDEMKKRLATMKLPINKTADEIEKALKMEFNKIGVHYNPSEGIKNNLIEQYNKNMQLYIVDEENPLTSWNSQQTERLRNMVTKSAINGYQKNTLIEMIKNEFEVSMNKARFLARQETSLFYSELRDQRYMKAGVKIYQWLGSNDVREVGNPNGLYPKGNKGHGNHWDLNRKYCKYDDDSVYADTLEDAKNNIWKSRANIGCPNTSPGRQYLCRCIAKPIII